MGASIGPEIYCPSLSQELRPVAAGEPETLLGAVARASRMRGAWPLRAVVGGILASVLAVVPGDPGAVEALSAGSLSSARSGAPSREAPGPRELLAGALDVPISEVLEAVDIAVDRRRVGAMGLFSRGGETLSVVVGAAGEPAARLGPADQIWCAGIVDLRTDSKLRLARHDPARLRSSGSKHPVLLLGTRHEQAVAPAPRTRSVTSRATGLRHSIHLFLVELRPMGRVLLTLETEHRSEDGFGGHDVGGLVLRQQGEETFLEGVRQDHLPASRARCVEPEPYPVRFELAGGRFRELPVARPLDACG